MWKRLFAVIFVLSLALNIGFGATWALRRFGGKPKTESAPESRAEIWSPLHRKLDVTKKQWEKLEPLVTSFQQETQKQAKKLQNLRDEMVGLLSSAKVDRSAVEKQQERILEGFRGMQDIVLGHLIREKQILTAEQEKRLFEIVRRHTGCPAAGGAAITPDQGSGRGVGSLLREMEERN